MLSEKKNREGQILYDLAYLWNLKKKRKEKRKSEREKKRKASSQKLGTDWWLPDAEGGGVEKE